MAWSKLIRLQRISQFASIYLSGLQNSLFKIFISEPGYTYSVHHLSETSIIAPFPLATSGCDICMVALRGQKVLNLAYNRNPDLLFPFTVSKHSTRCHFLVDLLTTNTIYWLNEKTISHDITLKPCGHKGAIHMHDNKLPIYRKEADVILGLGYSSNTFCLALKTLLTFNWKAPSKVEQVYVFVSVSWGLTVSIRADFPWASC